MAINHDLRLFIPIINVPFTYITLEQDITFICQIYNDKWPFVSCFCYFFKRMWGLSNIEVSCSGWTILDIIWELIPSHDTWCSPDIINGTSWTCWMLRKICTILSPILCIKREIWYSASLVILWLQRKRLCGYLYSYTRALIVGSTVVPIIKHHRITWLHVIYCTSWEEISYL